MKECFELVTAATDKTIGHSLEIKLDFGQRQKSRNKARTDCGETLGWFLERCRVLEDGDLMRCNDGTLVKVIAAQETVSQASCDNDHLLMRAAYHLGNRHVPLQIGNGWLRYQQDHVLDSMLQGLGLTVVCCERPFHPENGAYNNHHGH